MSVRIDSAMSVRTDSAMSVRTGSVRKPASLRSQPGWHVPFIVALALVFSFALSARGQNEPRASLTLEEADERVTGDIIKARFIVRGDEGERLLLRSPKLEGIKVRNIERSRFIPSEGVHYLDVEFVALRPGQPLLGPFTIEILSRGETKLAELSGRPLTIRSALEGAESFEPKPRAAPLPIRVPDGTMIVLLYVLAALAILLPLAILLIRRIMKARAARRPPPPPRPPWERALAAIERLRGERKTGIHEDAIEAFTDELSDILRAYLGERYGFDGLESTSDELLESLETISRSGAAKQEAVESVRAFLHEADLVKFARARLDADQLDAILYSARRIVLETRPFINEETIR